MSYKKYFELQNFNVAKRQKLKKTERRQNDIHITLPTTHFLSILKILKKY